MAQAHLIGGPRGGEIIEFGAEGPPELRPDYLWCRMSADDFSAIGAEFDMVFYIHSTLQEKGQAAIQEALATHWTAHELAQSRYLPGHLMAQNHRLLQSDRPKTTMSIIMQIRAANAAALNSNFNLPLVDPHPLAFLNP